MTTPSPAAPVDPYASKAIVSALTTVIGVGVQWAATGHFTLEQEGTTAIVGAVVTLLVYAVSNGRRLLGR